MDTDEHSDVPVPAHMDLESDGELGAVEPGRHLLSRFWRHRRAKNEPVDGEIEAEPHELLSGLIGIFGEEPKCDHLPQSSSSSFDIDTAANLDDFNRCSFKASLRNVKANSLTLPWKTNQMKAIFGRPSNFSLPTMDPLAIDGMLHRLPISQLIRKSVTMLVFMVVQSSFVFAPVTCLRMIRWTSCAPSGGWLSCMLQRHLRLGA